MPPRIKGLQTQPVLLPAISTISLGLPGRHSLTAKLEAASRKGFLGVEICWEDLVFHGRYIELASDWPDDGVRQWDSTLLMLAAARHVRDICAHLGLHIICLQAFRDYDGIALEDRYDERIPEFRKWVYVANELGVGYIGVPSTLRPHCRDITKATPDPDHVADDIRWLAREAAPYNVKIAYENLCFGHYIKTWQQAWDVICRVGLSHNVAFLPDSFNLCGDTLVNASTRAALASSYTSTQDDVVQSLKDLAATIPLERIPFIQIADAEGLDEPLAKDHPWLRDGADPKMAWSRNARQFPFEANGCMPVLPVVEEIRRAGWCGYVSFEVFSRSKDEPGDDMIWDNADRAWKSWCKLTAVMNLEVS